MTISGSGSGVGVGQSTDVNNAQAITDIEGQSKGIDKQEVVQISRDYFFKGAAKIGFTQEHLKLLWNQIANGAPTLTLKASRSEDFNELHRFDKRSTTIMEEFIRAARYYELSKPEKYFKTSEQS